MWIEVSGRLVSEDNLGIVDKCSSDTYTLGFSSRKGFYETLFLVKKSDSGENFWNFLGNITIFVSAHFHSECDIFANGFGSEKLIILKYNPDTSTIGKELFFRIGIDILSFCYEKFSGFRLQIPDEHFDKTCFSASGTSYKEYEFSRIDGYISILEDIFIPVRKRNIFYFHGEIMIINAHIIQKMGILQAMRDFFVNIFCKKRISMVFWRKALVYNSMYMEKNKTTEVSPSIEENSESNKNKINDKYLSIETLNELNKDQAFIIEQK